MARNARKRPFLSALSGQIANGLDGLRGLVAPGSNAASNIAAAGVLAACVALLWWGVPRLQTRLAERASVAAASFDLEFTNTPGWFDGLRHAEVRDRVLAAVGDGSPLDQRRLATAREALLSTGWFRSVEQVRLADHGGFLVDATFVRPFAVVRHGTFDYLVDDEGRLLPMQWTAGHRPASPHFVAVIGSASAPEGGYGTQWPGADVAMGLELARLFAGRAWFGEVSAIDVSRSTDARELVLVTRHNGRVLWGRAPNDRSVAEVTPDAKLRTLDYLYATERRIDSGQGRVIDLRGDLVTLRADAAPGEQ